MKRWHQEQQHMFRQWKIEMRKHGYNPACPPTDPSSCHCVTGIGFFRKRKALDCGNPRCGICHWDKWVPKARATKNLQAIQNDLDA